MRPGKRTPAAAHPISDGETAHRRQARRHLRSPQIVRQACHILSELGDDALATL
jgi:hypothetical protein